MIVNSELYCAKHIALIVCNKQLQHGWWSSADVRRMVTTSGFVLLEPCVLIHIGYTNTVLS